MTRTDIRRDAVDLPVFALAALIEWEGVGEPHLTMRPPAVWREPVEHAEITRAALDALGDAGVLAGPGLVDPNLRDLMPLFATPVTEYHGWFTVDGRTKAVLAAAGRMDAVLAVRDDQHVRLRAIPRDRLLPALLAELPDVPPHPGDRLTVTAADLHDLHAPTEPTERRIPPHVAELLRILRTPPLDGGELYAGSRDRLGRHTLRGPVRYADTEQGRQLNYLLGGPDSLRIVLAPATTDTLTAALEHIGPSGAR